VSQRWVTFGLAVAALAVFYLLMFPKPMEDQQAASRPMGSEQGVSGYLGLWRWLSAEKIPVASLKDRYDTLPDAASRKPGGNILLTTLPHKIPVRPLEAMSLDEWISDGNTLVVAAALDDTPTWALTDGESFVKQLSRLTRLRFEVASPESARMTGKTIALAPRGTNPLLAGVHSMKVISDLPASRWRASSLDASVVLQVAETTDNQDAAIWIRRQGKGQIIVLGVAGLFSNRDLGSVDNARLLANIVAWNLGPGGRFIFDDVHQGAAKYYDAKAFFADPRLHRTLGWLVLLWFLFVLGVQRLRIAAPNWRPPDITNFVATSGEFFASTLTQAAAGGRLLENFFNGIRRRLSLPENGGPLFEWLGSQATVTPGEVQELKRMHARIMADRRIDLTALQNLLVKLQGKII
jgi:hypothetical protein